MQAHQFNQSTTCSVYSFGRIYIIPTTMIMLAVNELSYHIAVESKKQDSLI